jgi:putative transposase
MPDKFRNRYRIFSNRLQNWNYGWNASCFVTICTQGRECYFGRVLNGKMELSGTGIIANVLWCEITNHSKNIEYTNKTGWFVLAISSGLAGPNRMNK